MRAFRSTGAVLALLFAAVLAVLAGGGLAGGGLAGATTVAGSPGSPASPAGALAGTGTPAAGTVPSTVTADPAEKAAANDPAEGGRTAADLPANKLAAFS